MSNDDERASGGRRSLATKRRRSPTPCATAFSRARSRAPSETSVATMSRSSGGTRRCRRATARATAIAPLPVPTSATRRTPDRSTPDVNAVITVAIAVSTSSSVSGRGISARASTVSAIPWNSLMPRRYATGSPVSRLAISDSYVAVASAPTGASPWAMTAVRSTPIACASSSSASSLGVSDPAARRRSVPASTSARFAVMRVRSESDGDGDVADLAQDLGAGRAPPAVEQQVDRRITDAQVRQRDLAEPVGQVRMQQLELVPVGMGAEPEHGLEEQERGPGGPGLRRAGDRIRDRRRGVSPVEATEELRQSVVGEALGRLHHLTDEPVRRVVEAVPLESRGDQRRVMWPDGPGVVTDRVVAGLIGREGPHSPAGEHLGPKHPLDHVPGTVGCHDPGPEALARVAGDRIGLALVAIERHGVEA